MHITKIPGPCSWFAREHLGYSAQCLHPCLQYAGWCSTIQKRKGRVDALLQMRQNRTLVTRLHGVLRARPKFRIHFDFEPENCPKLANWLPCYSPASPFLCVLTLFCCLFYSCGPRRRSTYNPPNTRLRKKSGFLAHRGCRSRHRIRRRAPARLPARRLRHSTSRPPAFPRHQPPENPKIHTRRAHPLSNPRQPAALPQAAAGDQENEEPAPAAAAKRPMRKRPKLTVEALVGPSGLAQAYTMIPASFAKARCARPAHKPLVCRA